MATSSHEHPRLACTANAARPIPLSPGAPASAPRVSAPPASGPNDRASDPVSRPSRRRLIVALTACLVITACMAILATVALVLTFPFFSADRLRHRMIATLSSRFDADVEIGDLHARVLPGLRVEGAGLTIRPKGRRDVPPFISIRAFSADTGFVSLWRRHVSRLELTGLDIEIPPDHHKPDHQKIEGERSIAPDGEREVVIDDLESRDARLTIIPESKEKPSRVWAIHELRMHQLGFDRAMPFEATLTNAIPPGEIGTRGIFGPWQADDPGATPLAGTFTFGRADLAIFKGIAGILSAHGEFGGSLGRLGIHGETDTPDFTVAIGGHPVSLHTDYHATVDGTTGDTLLDRIDASFEKTSLVAKGSVVGTPGKSGRTVTLDIVMNDARLEDVLRLAVKAPKPPMVGT